MTKTQAINFSQIGAHFASLDSSYNKLWTVHYVEINVRVTGSEWERQQVSGNVEIQEGKNLAASNFRLLDEVYVKHLSPSMHTQFWGGGSNRVPLAALCIQGMHQATKHSETHQVEMEKYMFNGGEP